MDGEIVIGTKMDLKGIDKDIAKLEKRLNELDKKASKTYDMKFDFGDVAITGGDNLTEEEAQEYEEINNQLNILEAKKAEMLTTDEQITNEMKKQKKAIDEQNINHDTTASKLTGLLTQLDAFVKDYQDLSKEKIVSEESEAELQRIKTKIMEIIAEYEKLSGKKLVIKGITDVKTDLPQIKKGIDDLGKGLKKVTQKAKQWALAIFGVRSAYMLIRNAMNVLTEGDEQLKADIEYIKVALASALEPVIRWIVELMKKLLMYVGYIIKAWTGINIFENANENLEKANSSAKELKKTITGFDEMNVLSDNSSSSKGNTTPSFDIESLGDGDVPGWIKWISEHGVDIADIIAGITAAILALKLGFDDAKAAGIGLTIYGILELIKDTKDFIADPSWENFVKILGDILIITGGLMLLLTGNWLGLLIAGIGLLVKFIAEHWDSIKEILGKVWGWIDEHIIQPIYKAFKPLFDFIGELVSTTFENIKTIIDNVIEIFKGLIETIKGIFEPLVLFFKGIWDKIKDNVKKFATKVGEAIGSAFKNVINKVISAIENILNAPIKAINSLIKTVNKVPGVNLKKLKTFDLPRLAKGGIVNMPGSGVMVGNAIAGERGMEGVIPLTDNQQMQLLGQAIGKYITINANITNTMNGRVISRELQKIQNQDNFAYNR